MKAVWMTGESSTSKILGTQFWSLRADVLQAIFGDSTESN